MNKRTQSSTPWTLLVFLFASCSLFPASANAFIMEDDAVLETGTFSDYVIYLTLSIPPGQGLFAIQIYDRGNGEFMFGYGGIAESYALYTAVSGMALTPAYAQNHAPLISNYQPEHFYATVDLPLDHTLLFGYWDDRVFDGIPTESDNYGWFQLQNTADGLSIWGGATAIGGGIYVGTYTQIPEPSLTALFCTGAAALIFQTRRKARKP